MKMKIVDDDGAIQGWPVALGATIVVYALIIAAFVGGEPMQAAWINIGGSITGIYTISFGSWLAYKASKSIFGKNDDEHKNT